MAEFTTDPGERGVSELEREVDSERERLSATIDELRSRASMQSVVDQVVKAVAENGGDVSRNLGRSLRDNPLAAILTGVGIAWLMAGPGRQAERWEGERWDEENDVYGLYGRERLEAGEGAEASSPSYGGEWPAGTDDEEGGGLRERAADAAGRIGGVVSDAAEGLRERAAGAGRSAGGAMHAAGSAMHHAGDAVRRRAAATSRGARRRGASVQDGLDTLIREQPLVLGAIAMALGAAVGGALPRSRVEDRVMGAQSDRAMAAVRTGVAETAGAVTEEALDIADETAAAIGDRLPSTAALADEAAQRLREAGTRLRDAAEGDTHSERG
jgi:hypothetical protein